MHPSLSERRWESMKTEMQNLTDTSQVTKKNMIVIIITASAFALLLIGALYGYFVLNKPNLINVFIDLMFLYVLIERAQAKYNTEIDKRAFRITKKSLWGTTIYDIPYKDIFGVYRYKAELVRAVSFRRTYRLNSALDNRTVWTLAYRVIDKKGKFENRRIYFKASEEMLAALAEKVPNKVKVKEEQVAVAMLKADPDWDKK